MEPVERGNGNDILSCTCSISWKYVQCTILKLYQSMNRKLREPCTSIDFGQSSSEDKTAVFNLIIMLGEPLCTVAVTILYG